jgi:pimeloyl-ACP methyl ester carboxylesterase
MPSFVSLDDIEIAYYEWGTRTDRPVVLHHGFISNAYFGWKRRGLVDALVEAGHWVVALDARGHGESGKPHDPALYGEEKMAADLAGLLDVLEVPEADLVGYSMGAVVDLILATHDPRVHRIVTGGVGAVVAELGGADTPARIEGGKALAAALRTEDPSTIEGITSAAFRAFADRVGGDRLALAAQAEAMHVAAIPLERITAPTLVIAGDADVLAARSEVLAAAIPGANSLILPGDHLTTPVSPPFAAAIIEFFAKP